MVSRIDCLLYQAAHDLPRIVEAVRIGGIGGGKTNLFADVGECAILVDASDADNLAGVVDAGGLEEGKGRPCKKKGDTMERTNSVLAIDMRMFSEGNTLDRLQWGY